MSSSKRSQITITVELDKDQKPENIIWQADAPPQEGKSQQAKAMFLSLFDGEAKDTMKLDLWTKNFQVAEMDRLVFHSLRAMADAYLKGTNNKELANDMQKFAHYFAEETEIIPKDE
jgi:gliding motility-associated protein GldC